MSFMCELDILLTAYCPAYREGRCPLVPRD